MNRITAKQLREQQAAPAKRSKYGNTKVIHDGHRFDSKRELAYYEELKLREKAGEIGNVLLQPPFAITGPRGELICTYKADFQFDDYANSCLRIVDVKGVSTPVFRLKRKLMKILLGIEVEIVK